MKKSIIKTAYLCITALIISMSCFCLPVKSVSYVRGVWVASVSNLDFPSKQGLSSSQLKSELDSIVLNCKNLGINTVFFQVRPNADALYKSSVFPWSAVLSGTQGVAPDGDFDPLSYIVSACHNEGIELHAWINPYRICKADKLDTLCNTHPARLHPEYTVTCSDGNIYFNPALQSVRQLIVDGVVEIVKNYNVDGIHFDDYFYPYNTPDYPDSEDYKKYGAQFKTVEDFRRNNVNLLVKQVNEAVHKQRKSALFGISPFGIWDNKSSNQDGSDTSGMSSYREIYADSRAWVKNGWVDYICPQVYWSFENTAAPFETVTRWWASLCKNTDVDLYIGHALYKLGGEETGFESVQQIQRQLELCETLGGIDGSVFFRYKTLCDNVLGCADVVKAPVSKYTAPPTKAVTTKDITVTSIYDGFKTTADSISVSGYTDPSCPLTVNGIVQPVTKNGYFSAYTPLSLGENKLILSNDRQTKTLTVIKQNKTVDLPPENIFYQDSAFPSGSSSFISMSTLTATVDALPGKEVYVSVGQNEYPMSETKISDVKSTYSCDITMPNALFSDLDYGVLTFYAINGSEKIQYPQSSDITVSASAKAMYVTQECYAYDSVFGGSMMDNYQLAKGSVAVVTAFSNDNFRLSCGKWVSKEFLSDKKVRAKADIDTDNYKKITVSSDCVFEAYASVNECGALTVDLYGLKDAKVLSESIKDYTLIDRGNMKTLAIQNVTGFLNVRRTDKILDIYIYDKTASLAGKTIVLDAGHGGKDLGALGPVGNDGVSEADLNLAVCKLLYQKFTENGAKVLLTRNADTTLLLNERSAYMKKVKPDLCISIHHNSVDVSSDYNSAGGALVLYSRETSLPLANCISDSLTKGLNLKNEGVRAQSLNVCREYRFPSVLIECGYVCSPLEYELLLTDTFKNRLTDNIVTSICDYFGKNC